MVKGVSRQVIVVASPDKKLFDQAIFILKDGAENGGLSDAMLLKEAQKALDEAGRKSFLACRPLWACGGAAVTGLIWLITALA